MREPDRLRQAVALMDAVNTKRVKSNRLNLFLPAEDGVSVNNIKEYQVRDSHFGYPGRMRTLFSMTVSERLFQLFPAQPVRLPDGTWKSYEGGLDAFFGLKHDLKPKFIQVVEEDMKALIPLEQPSKL